MAKHPEKNAGRPGPKPRGPYQDKRKTITTRITESTRAALDDAANKADRSLSQEIEFRLVQSFSDESARTELLYREAGGSHNYALGKLIAGLAHYIEMMAGAGWTDDSYVFDYLMAGIKEAMSLLRRPEETCGSRRTIMMGVPPGLYEALTGGAAAIGEAAALGWLELIRKSPEFIKEVEGKKPVADTLRTAHEIGAILAPFILLKEDKASD